MSICFFSKLMAWNVSVTASGVFILRRKINLLAQKRSGEVWRGPNTFATLFSVYQNH